MISSSFSFWMFESFFGVRRKNLRHDRRRLLSQRDRAIAKASFSDLSACLYTQAGAGHIEWQVRTDACCFIKTSGTGVLEGQSRGDINGQGTPVNSSRAQSYVRQMIFFRGSTRRHKGLYLRHSLKRWTPVVLWLSTLPILPLCMSAAAPSTGDNPIVCSNLAIAEPHVFCLMALSIEP